MEEKLKKVFANSDTVRNVRSTKIKDTFSKDAFNKDAFVDAESAIGDYLGNVETNILETTLSIEADAIQANAGWQVFPNPVSALFEIRGYRSGQRWTVFDGWGRKVAEGRGSRVDASHWPVGMLWLVPSNSDHTITMRALKLNVVR